VWGSQELHSGGGAPQKHEDIKTAQLPNVEVQPCMYTFSSKLIKRQLHDAHIRSPASWQLHDAHKLRIIRI
jgi:hypothetical protein